MQLDQSHGPLDSLLARLLAAWPSSRLPPASYALYREKLANVPTNTLSSVIEGFIERGGKYIPHVGEILGQCKGSMEPANAAQDVWSWAGYSFSDFEKLPTHTKRVWCERFAARIEARARLNGRSVPSSQFLEPLDDVLFRLGMDSRGGLIDMDPLGLDGPKHVEYHAEVDVRSAQAIIAESAAIMRERWDELYRRRKKQAQPV